MNPRKKIEHTLLDLLKERGFTANIARGPSGFWVITYHSDASRELYNIKHNDPVGDQWWMGEEIGDKAPKTPFDAWCLEIDKLMAKEYGMGMNDFEDYNWWDEFKDEVPARESFEEWKLIAGPNSGN